MRYSSSGKGDSVGFQIWSFGPVRTKCCWINQSNHNKVAKLKFRHVTKWKNVCFISFVLKSNYLTCFSNWLFNERPLSKLHFIFQHVTRTSRKSFLLRLVTMLSSFHSVVGSFPFFLSLVVFLCVVSSNICLIKVNIKCQILLMYAITYSLILGLATMND